MIDLGLTVAERRAFEDQLAEQQQVRIGVIILDRDEHEVSSLTAPVSQVLSGDVQVDADAEVTRSLQLTVLDPERKLDIVPENPADAAVYADNFVAVTRGTYVSALERWVDVPVFWGPVSRMRRNDWEVEIEALGKEWLVQEPHLLWKSITYGRGRTVISALRDVLQEAGERRFRLPRVRTKLPKPLSVSRHQEAWAVTKRLAKSIDRQVFYDGEGRVRVRKHPENPVYTFITGGDDGVVIDQPELTFDLQKVRNTIEVLGPEPSGPKRRIRVVANAPANHPLSAAKLARNGEPRRMVEVVENEHLRRLSQAKNIAERTLRDRLRATVEVKFKCLAVPHVEEEDLCSLVLSDGHEVEFRLRKFSLPLTDGPMSVGILKRVSTGSTKRIRVRGRRRR